MTDESLFYDSDMAGKGPKFFMKRKYLGDYANLREVIDAGISDVEELRIELVQYLMHANECYHQGKRIIKGPTIDLFYIQFDAPEYEIFPSSQTRIQFRVLYSKKHCSYSASYPERSSITFIIMLREFIRFSMAQWRIW
jgi:hypothetical protein